MEVDSILKILSHHQPVTLEATPRTAAVMVILLNDGAGSLEIVLTERAPHLLTYAGDFSFPGGMSDAEDKDLYFTATREVQEELNISAHAYQRIAQLDDFHDRFGHLVRPFVTYMSKQDFEKNFRISPDEIARVYYFSLSKLNDLKDNPELHQITRRRPSYSYAEENVFVWGLTAAILVHFSNVVYRESRSLGKIINPG